MGEAKNGVKVLRKISTKSVYGKIKKGIEAPIAVMRVYGSVMSVQEKSTDYGISYKFVGQFKAVHGETLETYKASVMFLPGIAEEMLLGSMQEGKHTEFAFDIQAIPDDDSVTGYVYTADSLLMGGTDPLAELEKRLNKPAK